MDSQPSSKSAAVYRRLLAYVAPHRRVLLVAAAAMVVHAAADAIVPFLMAAMVAELQSADRNLSGIALLLIIAFPIRGAADFGAVYALNWVAWSVVRDLRRALFAHYLALPASYLDTHASAPLISTLTYNTERVAEALSGAAVVLVRDALVVVVLFGVMIYMSPGLTVVTVILAPSVGLLVSYAGRALRRVSGRIQNSMGDFTHAVQQLLGGLRIVKVFEAQSQVAQAFTGVNERNMRLHLRLAATRALSESLTVLMVGVGVAVIVFVALSPAWLPEVDAPTFMGFISAMGMLLAPLRRLTNANALVQRAVAAAEGLFDVLDQQKEPDSGTLRLERAEGHIEFRNVSFRFRGVGEPVLDNVSLDAPAGSEIAVVGRSGSGKSTLVSLLCRFYDVDAGAIFLDGKDIRSYRLQDLRRQLSVVGQNVMLFDDTIANNIAYGALARHSRGQIEAAAAAASVTEFAASLPRGLDFRIGERGLLLSGGQRQRIAIARALLKDAPILILDEATSELDSETEQRIYDAVEQLRKGRTTLVIAHRLSTIAGAERIVAFDRGRIVEAGTHAELMRLNGYYAALQRAGYSNEPHSIAE